MSDIASRRDSIVNGYMDSCLYGEGTNTKNEVHLFLEDICLFLVRISLKWALEHDSVVQRGKCLSVSLSSWEVS